MQNAISEPKSEQHDNHSSTPTDDPVHGWSVFSSGLWANVSVDSPGPSPQIKWEPCVCVYTVHMYQLLNRCHSPPLGPNLLPHSVLCMCVWALVNALSLWVSWSLVCHLTAVALPSSSSSTTTEHKLYSARKVRAKTKVVFFAWEESSCGAVL